MHVWRKPEYPHTQAQGDESNSRQQQPILEPRTFLEVNMCTCAQGQNTTLLCSLHIWTKTLAYLYAYTLRLLKVQFVPWVVSKISHVTCTSPESLIMYQNIKTSLFPMNNVKDQPWQLTVNFTRLYIRYTSMKNATCSHVPSMPASLID